MDRSKLGGTVAGGLLAAWGLFLSLGLTFFKLPLAASLPHIDVTSIETSLCFVLAGASLLSGSIGTPMLRRWQTGCAGAVLAIAAFAAGRYLAAGALSGAPSWLAWIAPAADANRMTPATAAALAAGGAILAFGQRIRGVAAAYGMQFLLLVLLALALLANVGHLLNWAVDFSLFDMGFRRQALGWATAIGLIPFVAGTFLLSTGMSWYRTLYDERPDRQIFALSTTMLLVVTIVAGLVGAGVFARETVVAFKEAMRSALAANSQLVVDAVDDTLKEVEHLARISRLESLLQRHVQKPGAETQGQLQDELDRIFRAEGEDGPAAISIYDANGRTLATTGQHSLDGENRIRLATRQPAWLFWLGGYRLETHYVIADSSRTLAKIVAEFRLDQISKQLNFTGPLGASGEVVICGQGKELLDCYPSRLMPRVYHVPPTSKGQLLPMAHALAGEENSIVAHDYRGKPVIAAFKPLPGLGLGMVQKIDADEFYAAVRQQFWLSTLVACLLVFGAAAILYRRIHPTVRALDHVSRLYAVLSKSNRAIVRVRDLRLLLEEICHIAVNDGAFVMAWAGVVADGRVIPYAHAGREEGYLEQARIIVRDRALGAGPTGAAINEGRHFVCDNIATDPRMKPWRTLALARGYRSSAAFPVRIGGEVVGALNFYAPTTHFFSPVVIDLLDDLTEDVSFAMNALAESDRLRQAEEDLSAMNQQLERRVQQRTQQLEAANKELEAFSYSVSHDLRAPLRAIDGFSQVLVKRYAEKFDDTGRDYLNRVRRASQRMGNLIDDLLDLSRVTRGALRRQDVDVSALANGIVEELRRSAPEREVEIRIQEGMQAVGDSGLLRAALDNLLGNAWKFTRHTEPARITFDCRRQDDELVYCVRDNGAGFDNAYAKKLFQVFQRLHSDTEFEGTGIGLATVQRIIQRHGGRVWAEGEIGAGAAFFFTLPRHAEPVSQVADAATERDTSC